MVAALIAAGGGASAQQPSQREPVRYWFVWPDSTVWSRVQQWVPVQADAVRCVLQEERSGLTFDGFAYLPGAAPPPRVDTVTVIIRDTVYVPTPPDTVIPPDTTTPQPAPARSLDVRWTPTSFGADVEAFLLDSLGTGIAGDTVRYRVTGDGYLGATAGVKTMLRTSVNNGRTVVGWRNPESGDTVYISAAGVSVALPADTSGAVPPPPNPPPPPPVPPAPTDSTVLTPPALLWSIGPLIAATGTGVFGAYDAEYLVAERNAWQKWLATEGDPGGAWLDGQHYGALRGRLSYAIRHGEPFGPGVTDRAQFGYARGAYIVREYLKWAHRNGHSINVHLNTGLADIEALYVLEGDADALMHIHCSAGFAARADIYDYAKLTNPKSGARIPAQYLQAMHAAHRYGLPYAACPENSQLIPDRNGVSSWIENGDRIVAWLDQYGGLRADGSVRGLDNGQYETFFMSGMLADQLVRWHALTGNARAFEQATAIVDHLVDAYNTTFKTRGWRCLPYLPNSTSEACDLGGFYVFAPLVLWQETGDAKYRDFALQHFSAIAGSAGFSWSFKQFNQGASLPQNAEALLAGVRWR
jgi:hypothetical protein